MKRTGWILVGVILIILALIKIFLFSPSTAGKTPLGKKPPTGVGVIIMHPTSADQIINVSGTILPWENVKLQPEISARVTGIFFNEGSAVTKGQLLIKLYDADLQAQRQKIQAQLDAADAELKRQTKLLAVNATSQDVYDNANTAVKGLKADLAVNSVAIEKTEIVAPFNGVVGNRYISAGSVISPGTVIATLYQTTPLRLECAIPSVYRDMLHVGLPVEFVTNKKTVHPAKIYSIEPMADANDRTFTVRAEYTNANNDVFPGDFAHVTVNLGHSDTAILVPTDALVPILKGQLIYIAHNNKAKAVPVETGQRNDTAVLITKGLHPGDSVIVSGVMMMKPDVPIKITSAR